MNRKLISTIVLISVFGVTACSKASNSAKDSTKTPQENMVQKVSAEDQKIIDKHNEYVEKYSMADIKVLQKHMREILPEVDKITDKRKRELLQMNIYMILNDYDKAHTLNDKQLTDRQNDTARLTFRCQLLTLQKKEATLINKCYDNVAGVLKVELDKPENKTDPNYKLGEFSYLFAKYKGGHPEYKQKMQRYIADTKDEKLKASLKRMYDLEIEN